jgi:hypothetical protein
MFQASERLTVHSNHLQSSGMAAANTFYGIVAGVGAGTGMAFVFLRLIN